MNIVFLRGAIPPSNEHPEKLYYSDIESCEDVWTQLFYCLTRALNASGELLYTGGDREYAVGSNFIEKWVPKIEKYSPKNIPDLIICRGGFPYYEPFIKKFPKAKKIYYGAGSRFYPTEKFSDYDLFLVDSKSQLKMVQAFNKNAHLFIKPAANLFKPVKTDKIFDICFMANATQGDIKRHDLLIRSFSKTKYKILNIGNKDKKYIHQAKKLKTNIQWDGWSLRKELPQKISQCKIGICCSSVYDSCPRVVPEYLACGLPVVAVSNMNLWESKYITKDTGIIVSPDNLLHGAECLLKKKLNTSQYYKDNLSIDKAVEYLVPLVEKII